MRIIGCGSAGRGDDGAGLLVAARLRELGVPALEQAGDASALLHAWAGSDDVILVDAVVTGAPAGAVSVWEGRPSGLVRGAGLSSHGLGLAEALDLARALGRLPRRLRVFGIEGGCFERGAQPSPAVRQAVEEVAQRIAVMASGRPPTPPE